MPVKGLGAALQKTKLAAVLASAWLSPPLAAAASPLPPAEIAPIPVVVLADIGSGQVLYSRQADLSFVPASVAKVMTTYVAFEQIARHRLDPATLYAVRPETARAWKGRGTSLRLDPGAQVPVDVLLRGITTVSANDAAVVLAEGFAGSLPRWAALMNAEARALGMTRSHFASPNGYPDGGATYVSATDLIRLASAMIVRHPALYHRYVGQKTLTWNGISGENHDPMIGIVPGADGIKTGFTREAGYNFLGTAARGRRRLAIVVAGARTAAERAAASRALIEWGFAEWAALPLFAAGRPVVEARVQGGTARVVGLVTPQAIHASLPRGSQGGLRLRVVYRGPLVAPIAKGAQIAELEIVPATGAPGRVPLFAAQAVGRAGALDRLVNGLLALWS